VRRLQDKCGLSELAPDDDPIEEIFPAGEPCSPLILIVWAAARVLGFPSCLSEKKTPPFNGVF
jgi:hypothetical protein